jgi:hypothetical protein
MPYRNDSDGKRPEGRTRKGRRRRRRTIRRRRRRRRRRKRRRYFLLGNESTEKIKESVRQI